MRINGYICDNCGKDIIPEHRPIVLPGGSSISSSRKSIQQLTFQQIDVEDNTYILTTEQQSKSYQLCQGCWDAVCNTMKARRAMKNESTKKIDIERRKEISTNELDDSN